MTFFSKLKLNLIVSEKCVVTPNFLFGFQKHLLSPASLDKPLKRILKGAMTIWYQFPFLANFHLLLQ